MRLFQFVIAPLLVATAASVSAEPARLWSGLPEAQHSGWSFTPSFEPDGQAAWFQYWADPLNVEAPQQIFRVERRDGRWDEPQPVPVAPGQLVDWPLVTPDGERLIVSVAHRLGPRIFDFDLYSTALPLQTPIELERLPGKDLNRPKTAANATRGVAANEFGARMSDDGTLWFWSEREDATGSRDLFFAAPEGEGFAAPEEFSGNTRWRESHPWISPDGNTLVFASNRPGGFGGDDLWLTRRSEGDDWEAPCPLPASVNSRFNEELAGRDPVSGQMLFTSDRPFQGERGYRVYQLDGPMPGC